MNFKRTVLIFASAVALVAVGTGVGAVSDWFSQRFQGEEGDPFTGQGGATGGTWATIASDVATVTNVAGRTGIAVDTSKNTEDAIAFTASTASTQDIEQFDFSVCTKPMLQDLPALGTADKGALAVRSDDDGKTLFFAGYTAEGWTNLFWNGFSSRADAWIDCRATFDYSDANTVHVTYWAKGTGGTYVPLADARGVSCFKARSKDHVKTIVFCGCGTVGDFTGMKGAASVQYTWKGGAKGDWNTATNWDPEGVPDDGEIATIGRDATITYGETKIAVDGSAKLAIYRGDYIRIISGTVAFDKARAFGRVIVDPGATLVASGTFGALELGYASTLKVTPGEEPGEATEVLGRAVCVDGVKIDLTYDPGAETEGVEALVGPYGSVGTPLALTADGKALTDWTSAWYGKVDGRMGLWLVNGAYEGRVAVWKGGEGNLVDEAKWTTKPSKSVAAEMRSGTAHMNTDNTFAFARRFEIGKGGTAQVDMTDGVITGEEDNGALLVGTDGGAGALQVFGGRVTAKGDLSIGDAGSGSMTLSKGAVQVTGSFAVGNQGSLGVSEGSLVVDGSTYIGRSTGEAYKVTMTVTGGAVTNGDVFLVGSYGGPKSKAVLNLKGGEIKAGNTFVCGGYRSADVTIAGGTLKAKEIVLGRDLTDEGDHALLTVTSGRVETEGFTGGATGARQLTLTGGEIAATAANEDFFRGIESVNLDGATAISCAEAVTTKAALVGAGGFVKTGAGTFKVGGYAAWAGKTVVEEGVLDMDGGMVHETEVAPDASLVNAKYDDVDQKTFDSVNWTSGTATTKPYVRLSFSMKAGEDKVAVATAPNGATNGAFRIRSEGTGWVFSGWTALGWTDLAFADGTSSVVEGTTYEAQMLFDFSSGKPYVFYYVKKGGAYGRLVSPEKLTAFPVALGLTSVKTFAGVALTQGEQLSVKAGSELYWIGGASGKWNDGSKWSATKGGASAGTYPKTGNTATVDDKAEITLSDSAVGSLVLHARVTLVGSKLTVGKSLGGGGTLVLTNAAISCGTAKGVISVPIEILEGASSSVLGSNMTLGGALRGSGAVTLGVQLAGDTSAFKGTVSLTGGAIAAEAATHNELSAWDVSSCFPFVVENLSVAFGALNGTMTAIRSSAANVTVSAGARDEDCELAGSWKAGGHSGLKWTAARATMTYSMANTAFLELSGGGRVKLAAEAGVPTSSINFADAGGELVEGSGVTADISGLLKNSTAPVVYHDDDTDRTWANAFASSNRRGFVKRGNGTLTWLSAPEGTPDVTVESGALVVPAGTKLGYVSLGANATLKVDLTDVQAGGIVFSAVGANRKLKSPHFELANVPAGFECSVIEGSDNSVVIVSGSKAYAWTGASGDGSWSNVENWSVKGVVPDRAPKGFDTVAITNDGACLTIRLADDSAAAKIIGRGDVRFVGPQDAEPKILSVALAFEQENGRVGLENVTLNVGTELNARSVFGEGTIAVTGGSLTVSPNAEESEYFEGVIAVTNLVKRGSGTFAYTPKAPFSGRVSVDQGTLRWDCSGEGLADQVDAELTMASGATLDLCDRTVRVKGFTGAGTIVNGFLETTTHVIAQSGGELTVPAVEGMTYVASRAGEVLKIQAPNTDVEVTIMLPATWFAAGASGRRAIQCSSGAQYITWDIQRSGVTAKSEGDGWWSIPCGGFAVRLQ